MDVILMSAATNSENSNQTPGADRSANQTDPDRNLALELVRATEAAAIACSRYMGFGDKEQVDQAAVDAMRPVLGSVRMNGVVVIGEGEKDEAPMLFNGEHVGDGTAPTWTSPLTRSMAPRSPPRAFRTRSAF